MTYVALLLALAIGFCASRWGSAALDVVRKGQAKLDYPPTVHWWERDL